MMKKNSVIVYILICSVFTLAQNADDSGWKVFTGYKEEFTVNAPAGFELLDYDKKDEESVKNYIVKADNTYFAIWTAKDIESSRFPIISSFIQNNNADAVDQKIGSFKAKVFNFADTEGYSHKVAFVETYKRFFIIHSFGSASAQGKFAQFFDSFKINQTFTQSNKSSLSFPANKKTDSKPVPVNKTGTGSGQGRGREPGSGSGIGQGNGRGIGSGSGSGGEKPVENKPPDAGTPKPAPVTEPLQIISRPRANYTDMARIYGVQGTITLRVTFSANGSIGGISVVSGLPLGLTKNAIEAARNLTFKPTTVNGVPQTVTKMVQYSFTFY